MRSVRPAVLLSGLLLLLPASAARAQKLDNDDKKFLSDVRPLMLPDEEATYKKLKDKADRLEFQKIFWARRDPDLATPQNEFQEQYLKDRATADQQYRVAVTQGSSTDCGRVFILLGKPDDVEQEATSANLGLRTPETWIYKDRPDRRIQGGRAAISFDSDCRGTGNLAQQLDRIAATKVVHPNIGYKVGKDGHIVKLAEQLPRDTKVRALFKQPRQDFPLAVQPAYLKVADGGTALLGVVQGDASGLVANEGAGGKTVNISVAASAESADGKEAGWTEQGTNAPVTASGRFLGSFKMGLKPGKYTLRAGVLDLKGEKGTVVSLPIEVPDFSQVQTAPDGTTKPVLSATVIVVREIKDVPPGAADDPANPFAAFRLTTAQLIPVLPGDLHKSDTVSFFIQAYDLQVDPATGKANGGARLRVMKEGKGLVTSSGETAIQTPVFGTEVGPVPLAPLEPGKYVARLEVTDKIAQKTITQDAPFEIQP